MLAKLVEAMDSTKFENVVVSLTDKNVVGRELEDAGFRVHELNLKRTQVGFRALRKLQRLVTDERADVVQTWLYHADLVGGVAARCAGGIPIIWNVRNSSVERNGLKLLTTLTIRVCAILSHFIPKRIVFCSQYSRQVHESKGYCSRKMIVIPNGLNLTVWKPDRAVRSEAHRKLGLPSDAMVIGHVARFHYVKNQAGFVEAARLAHQIEPSLHFVMCGEQVDWTNQALAELVEATGIRHAFRLLGPRDDVPKLLNAMDTLCCSSLDEAFPNVLLEAMACGVPCVTTDVGDARCIVGESGLVVPPRDAPALAQAMVKMARLQASQRDSLGQKARERAATLFDISVAARAYASLYTSSVFNSQRNGD